MGRGPKGHWTPERREGGREPSELPHLEGQDEDDARNGGDAGEPAPPDGGDDHRGQTDDEQGAGEPENLGQEWKMKSLLSNLFQTSSHRSGPAQHFTDGRG